MKHVYIAGHGRMKTTMSKISPTDVTINYAVSPLHNGSGGLSKAILTHQHADWADTTPPFSAYYEHYLTPDPTFMLDLKAKSFAKGFATIDPGDASDIYLLQTKGKNTATLSGIITFLKGNGGIAANDELTIYWTCCRSPVGGRSLGKVEWVQGAPVVKHYSSTRRKTTYPDSNKNGQVHTVVNSNVVTVICSNSADLTLSGTWLGVPVV